MNDVPLTVLFAALAGLICLSAFFAGSETAMMSLNRYRLRALVKQADPRAVHTASLLQRTDHLLGAIRIGSNLVKIWATVLATLIGARLFGVVGIVIGTSLLLLVLLIFAEVTPKALAAQIPEKIAFPASTILTLLLRVFYPVVMLVNSVSRLTLSLAGIDPGVQVGQAQQLYRERRRTAVDDAGDLIPEQHQGMLLNILELSKATVEDIMIPRNDVVGVDLEESIPEILDFIMSAEYTRLPVYEGDINNVIGVMHLRNVVHLLKNRQELTHEAIRKQMYTPYFVPEATPLHIQLLNFQKERRRFGVVVDEYGDVKGIITLVDLLEQIVGDVGTNVTEDDSQEITALDNDWYLLDASASVRAVNRHMGWELPTDGPKTINGVIVEYLESIPDALCGFSLGHYQFEITRLGETRIHAAKVRTLENQLRRG